MRIYIFGVGEGNNIVRNCLKRKAVICGYIDNNQALHGQKMHGKEIVGLHSISKNYDVILISIQKYHAVYSQLLSAGIEKEKILCFYSIYSIFDKRFRSLFNLRDWKKAVYHYNRKRVKQFFSPLDPYIRASNKWINERGDQIYRLNYDLDPESVVYDLGGYHGDFTQAMVDKYHCYVWVFEPVPKFADSIKERFKDDPKVHVFCMGLAEKSSNEILYFDEDGSSVYKKGSHHQMKIKYYAAKKFFREHKVTNIDLMKINIEGGEYALLEHLIQTGDIKKIKNIQVQFHNIPGIHAWYRMIKIWIKLDYTHYVTWKFRPYIWENWRKRVNRQ